MKIQEKVAVITGGGTGVGRATALDLARGGCRVAINYSRSRAEAERTVSDIQALGGAATAIQADVARDDDCRRLAQDTLARFGRIDILVNSAGTTQFIPCDDLDAVREAAWTEIMAVNVQGPFQMARAVKNAMIEAGEGEIVSVSSIAAYRGEGSCIPYCASKGALNTLTLALARVLCPTIRVNAVAPGFITGRWLKKGLAGDYERVKTEFDRQSPLGRVSDPEDIAAAIVSIITGSDQVTGQTLVCDGGMMTGATQSAFGSK